MEIVVSGLSQAEEGARRLLDALGERRHVALEGPMGAGKTTLTAALCRVLGLVDEVSSPTFSIINEYAGADGMPAVYHFDFYRVESPEEAMDLGLEDYFGSGALCLMEWSGNIGALIPEDTVTVRIDVRDDGARVLTLD